MNQVVKFYEIGAPSVLRLEKQDPGAPKADEVLLQVEAIGMNRAEAAFRAGHYIIKPTLPSTLGTECTGRILQVGANVKDWHVGDAVCTLPTFLMGQYGVYGEQAVLPASSLIRRPDGMSPVDAAATWTAFLTAWGGLVQAGNLKSGESVIITAASSSVGLAAIQIARDIGATPIAVTRRRTKADALVQAGAAHVIASEEEDVKAVVSNLTNGQGARLIFDPVAGPFAEMLCECLTDEGMLIIYGGLSNKPAVFPRHLAIRKNLMMRGFNFFPLVRDRARLQIALDYLMPRLADGRFKMPIAHQFHLQDVVKAHETLELNQHVGKLVMVVSA